MYRKRSGRNAARRLHSRDVYKRQGVYDDHVYLAKDLEEAYELAKKLYIREEYKTLKPYFENNYYDKLPAVFKEKVI